MSLKQQSLRSKKTGSRLSVFREASGAGFGILRRCDFFIRYSAAGLLHVCTNLRSKILAQCVREGGVDSRQWILARLTESRPSSFSTQTFSLLSFSQYQKDKNSTTIGKGSIVGAHPPQANGAVTAPNTKTATFWIVTNAPDEPRTSR
jgi:hypothetical protein